MKVSLLEKFRKLSDSRRSEGKRHSIEVVLMISLMSFVSGIYSYRGIASFAKRHKKELIKILKIPKDRVPSYPTIRRVFISIDPDELALAFRDWLIENDFLEESDWISIDGKSLRGTLTDYSKKYQNFVSIVSAFSHSKKFVLMSKSFENKKASEIPVVAELILSLAAEDLTITMDALHCKKNSGSN